MLRGACAEARLVELLVRPEETCMLTTTAFVVVGMVVALGALLIIWGVVRMWRARRAEYLRRQHQLGSALNARIHRERGG